MGEFSMVGRRDSEGVVRPASFNRLDSEILWVS
jgi:hypothetical protein